MGAVSVRPPTAPDRTRRVGADAPPNFMRLVRTTCRDSRDLSACGLELYFCRARVSANLIVSSLT